MPQGSESWRKGDDGSMTADAFPNTRRNVTVTLKFAASLPFDDFKVSPDRKKVAVIDVAFRQHSLKIYTGLGDAFFDERREGRAAWANKRPIGHGGLHVMWMGDEASPPPPPSPSCPCGVGHGP